MKEINAQASRYRTHHAIGAVGARARRVGVHAVVLQNGVERLVLAASEQCLQGIDVADGVPQDLHFGQPLVRVGVCATFQRLEGLVDFA